MHKLLFTILFLTFALPVFALEGESAAARGNSTVQVGYTPFGLSVPGLSAPVALGYYVNEEILVGVESGGFTVEFDGDTASGNIDYSNQGLFARWWIGNSFNLLGGYYQRELSGSATVSETIAVNGSLVSAEATGSVTSKASVLSLGIGNQWQFDFGLVLGGDWAIYNSVLSHDYSYDVSNSLGYETPDDAKQGLADAEPDFEALHGLPGILHFYVGFAF